MSLKGRLIGHFLKGLLILAPVGFTLFICYKLFVWINSPLANFLQKHAPQLNIPGLGFVVTAVLATAMLIIVGYFSSNLVMTGVMDTVERQIGRLPLIKLIYSSLKDMIGAFAGKNRAFDQPVLVSPSGDGGLRLPGFVTRKSMESWGLPGHVAVYLPQSYNFAGQLIIVPKERVTPIAIASADMMSFIVSGGISGKEPKVSPKTD